MESVQQDALLCLLHHCTQEYLRGLVKSSTEVMGHLQLMEKTPDVLCFNETLLDKSVGSVALDQYVCVARRDRGTGCGGGVATYAYKSIAQQITHLGDSVSAECQWLVLHAEHGPILLASWYRPPGAEPDAIRSLEQEWQTSVTRALGT